MVDFSADFIFALCNPGSERAMKLEVEAMGLGWRSSYQRRGFLTFKTDAGFGLDALRENVACARRLCLSLGKFTTREDAVIALKNKGVCDFHQAKYFERKMQGIVMPEVMNYQMGDSIGTVVELGEAEFWAGIHRHDRLLSRDPAGDSGIEMPLESPSRAWLKLEEAVRFFDLDFSRRDVVVELGCAPGGVVLALLNRGVSVIGVDPAKMAEVVMKQAISDRQSTPRDRAWFYHCRKPAALTAKRDLGQDVTWFMSDMNQSPEVVLKECSRFKAMAPSIQGVLITLKLTQMEQVVDKFQWFSVLRDLGFTRIRLQQLAVNHKEFALLATC